MITTGFWFPDELVGDTSGGTPQSSPRKLNLCNRTPNRAGPVPQTGCLRLVCRCFRAASNFPSRSARTSCCRPSSMPFGVMHP